jgi:hypothetical protein
VCVCVCCCWVGGKGYQVLVVFADELSSQELVKLCCVDSG